MKIKRVYEAYEEADGYRVLVDRIWPRGIRKEDAHIDLWLKEIAPSTDLRKWFNHVPEKFPAFKSAYIKELQKSPASDAFAELTKILKAHDNVTLVYGAKDTQHNQAVVLQEYVKKHADHH